MKNNYAGGAMHDKNKLRKRAMEMLQKNEPDLKEKLMKHMADKGNSSMGLMGSLKSEGQDPAQMDEENPMHEMGESPKEEMGENDANMGEEQGYVSFQVSPQERDLILSMRKGGSSQKQMG